METKMNTRNILSVTLTISVLALLALFLSTSLTACSKPDVNSLDSGAQKTSGTVRILDDN